MSYAGQISNLHSLTLQLAEAKLEPISPVTTEGNIIPSPFVPADVKEVF